MAAGKINNFVVRRRVKVTQPSLTNDDLIRAVRAEISHRDSYLEFAQKQMELDRAKLSSFLKFALVVSSLAALGISAFTSNSLKGFREDLADSGKNAILAATSRADASVQSAVTEYGKVLDRRFADEFAGEKIQSRIKTELQGLTDRELRELVATISEDKVEKAVSAAQPGIQRTINSSAENIVRELAPTIQGAVSKEINTQVEDSVAPVRKGLGELEASLKVQKAIGGLSNVALNRSALEYLVEVAKGARPESAYPDVRKLAANQAEFWSVALDPSILSAPEYHGNVNRMVLKERLKTGNYQQRSLALGAYPKDSPDFLAVMVDVARHDESLQIGIVALGKIYELTGKQFNILKLDELNSWCVSSKAACEY
jgi:hypothetical protein